MKLIGLALFSILVFSACDNQPKEKKPGQALVSINGQEVTTLQLNDEIRRAGVRAEQYEASSKQLLESLIARQLIVDEAIRSKLDRTPDVMQARERANAQIITQAYLQGIVSKITKPSEVEINEYYRKHPEYFAQRKQFDLTILRIATKDLSSELRAVIDTAKSTSEVAAWLDKKNVQYFRNLASRSTADLPLEMVTMMREKGKSHVFVINEQENSLLISVNEIKDSPITATDAALQIERYLTNHKYKQAIDAEIARLRLSAKIEYLNAKAPARNTEKPATQPIDDINYPETVGNLSLPEPVSEGAIERGIMGLK
ncbi:EpsD family peptidyl-prolyl cis-trans isomerase [Nitrosomonas sp. Nm84]|uniref:EpsD family peptidyl-prolyl cis-trans isomerase n=1 Tax=Nitrosomonas sp. Nm84 TaxID=200124 RepID=UPI0021AC7EE1|nr:EpsD family peptidyl-prolyl cis-trans isomerase [Nitrosomonas sp. Nm84]